MTNAEKPAKTRLNHVQGPFALRLADTKERLGLTDPMLADYMGVPVFTVRKWLTGEREPGAAVNRLLDVLGILEVMAPTIHRSIMPTRETRL